MTPSQRYVILKKNKLKWLKLCPNLKDNSGIYILTREENGFKYAYIGQAKHILTRLAEHLIGYQHIDISLKKHKLYAEDNKTGWNVKSIGYDLEQLNNKEQEYIQMYANLGYQLRNKTIGSQGIGKNGLDVDKLPKDYRKGIKQGENKLIKEIKIYFDKYLDFIIKGKPNKIKERKYKEFEELLLNVED